ncbi:MAG: class I SAM-dependent methyltransferase [Microbacteriaceae bacterium]|nr:class I SAM-dependent methyltransferase [Microbacteriaceae bacterium]
MSSGDRSDYLFVVGVVGVVAQHVMRVQLRSCGAPGAGPVDSSLVEETSEAVYDSQFVRGLFDRMSRSYERMNCDDVQSRRLAAEVARILKPGGRYAFIEVTEPPNRVLRALYAFHLSRIVPPIGTLLAA